MKLFRRLIKRHFVCGSPVKLQKEYYLRQMQKEAKVYRNSAAQHRKSNVTKETITKLYIARPLWAFSAARAINSTFLLDNASSAWNELVHNEKNLSPIAYFYQYQFFQQFWFNKVLHPCEYIFHFVLLNL